MNITVEELKKKIKDPSIPPDSHITLILLDQSGRPLEDDLRLYEENIHDGSRILVEY